MKQTEMIIRNTVSNCFKDFLQSAIFCFSIDSSRENKESFVCKESCCSEIVSYQWKITSIFETNPFYVEFSIFFFEYSYPSEHFELDPVAIISSYVYEVFFHEMDSKSCIIRLIVSSSKLCTFHN